MDGPDSGTAEATALTTGSSAGGTLETSPSPTPEEGGAEERRAHRATTRSRPKWQADALERVRSSIRRFHKPLQDLIARDANEGDTRLLVTDFLCEGLGYDKYEELTTEYQVKGEFADYGIRIDKQLIAFLEVKRVAQKLSEKHLRQVQMYAVNEGVEWMILTNGQVWRVYHLSAGLPVAIDLAMQVDLLGEESLARKTEELFLLSREALRRRMLDDLWKAKAATSPRSLVSVLMSEPVIDALRKELRRRTGYNSDTSELARELSEHVIRPEWS